MHKCVREGERRGDLYESAAHVEGVLLETGDRFGEPFLLVLLRHFALHLEFSLFLLGPRSSALPNCDLTPPHLFSVFSAFDVSQRQSDSLISLSSLLSLPSLQILSPLSSLLSPLSLLSLSPRFCYAGF